jgi:hypothetical protein
VRSRLTFRLISRLIVRLIVNLIVKHGAPDSMRGRGLWANQTVYSPGE